MDPSGTTAKDITAGIILALDDYVTGGFAKWLVEKYQKKYLDYQYEDEKDYYLGRVFGAAIAEAIGAASTVLGIIELFGSIAAGGGITILSDGTAVGFGVSIAVEGVAVGVAEVGYGATVVVASAAGFGDELKSYNSAKNSASLGNFDKVNDRYLKKNGIDAHRLKEDVLGGKTRIAEYDIYKNKDTGELYIFKKGGKGAGIPTGSYLK